MNDTAPLYAPPASWVHREERVVRENILPQAGLCADNG